MCISQRDFSHSVILAVRFALVQIFRFPYSCVKNYYINTVLLDNHVCTAISMRIDGRFQIFQRFSRSELVLQTVESRVEDLNYYENGSICMYVCLYMWSSYHYLISLTLRMQRKFMYVYIYIYIHMHMYVCIMFTAWLDFSDTMCLYDIRVYMH